MSPSAESAESALPPKPSLDASAQLQHAMGSFGGWQFKRCLFVVCFLWVPGIFHLLNMVFFRAETAFWCSPPLSWDVSVWRNISAPEGSNSDGCSVYDVDFDKFDSIDEAMASPEYASAVASALTRECTSWEYDRSEWHNTIIQEWDLVCGRKDKAKLTQQVTFFGLLCGAILSGLISDRFGRIRTMLLLLITCTVAGTATAFAQSYELFLCGLWVCGLTAIGFGTVMYCWMMELLGPCKAKTLFGSSSYFCSAAAGLVIALVAFLVPDWRKIQLIISVPLLLLTVIFWIMPESPRWLLTHGRVEEAERIVRTVAAANGRPMPPDEHLQPAVSAANSPGVFGIFGLFRTPHLRKKTLILYYLWFATATVYYGLILNSPNLGASLFVYFTLGKVIEFPAGIAVMLLLLYSGRRNTVIILFALCATSLIGTMIIPTGVFPYEWPIVILNVLGRGSSMGALGMCYVYSAETYPTVVRSIGIGSSSVWARIGPMIAPYIADLGSIEPRLPIAVFGGIALLASFLVTFLPETTHHPPPDTLEDAEELGKGDTFYSYLADLWRNRNESKQDLRTKK